VPVTVENVPGAGGSVGGDRVAKSAPDGTTFYWGANGALTINPTLQAGNLTFDVQRDLTPVVRLLVMPSIVAVNNDVPAKSFAELMALAKAQPGKLSYASPGVGTPQHIAGELLKSLAGVNITHVPYRGVSQPMQDVAAGHIQLLHISLSSARGALASGEAKVLAILEPKRYAKLPGIPSMSEIIPAFRKPSTWFGFFGPAKLPPEIVARLNAEMRKAITAPEARAKLEASDLIIIAGTPDEFAALQREGIEQFGEIIKGAGIKPQ
jgi:tripartite-type tricarboxylate transporter receptor subunit TctC